MTAPDPIRAAYEQVANDNPLVCGPCGGPLPNPDCGHKKNGNHPCCVPATGNLADAIYTLVKQQRAEVWEKAAKLCDERVRIWAQPPIAIVQSIAVSGVCESLSQQLRDCAAEEAKEPQS